MTRLKRSIILTVAIGIGAGIGSIMGVKTRAARNMTRRAIFEAGMQEICTQDGMCGDRNAVIKDLEKWNPGLDPHHTGGCVVLNYANPTGSDNAARVEVCQNDDGSWHPTFIDLGSN